MLSAVARDEELVALLQAAPAAAWDALAAAADALAACTSHVTWQASEQLDDGSWTMPYPEYAEEVWTLTGALSGLGIVTPLVEWMQWDGHERYRTAADVEAAPPADLVRLATSFVRGERFSEGTLDTVTADGRLLALASALGRWHTAAAGSQNAERS